MRRAWIVGVVVSCSVVAGMLACVADPDTSGLPPYVPPVVTDGSVADTAQPPVDAAGDTHAADVQQPVDTGIPDTSTTCATLDLGDAGVVIGTAVDTAPPAMTGGAIASGTYAMTASAAYSPSGNVAAPNARQVLRFDANAKTALLATQLADAGFDAAAVTVSYDYATDGGAGISLRINCGATGARDDEYTVTDGGLLIAAPLDGGVTIVSSYAKQ